MSRHVAPLLALACIAWTAPTARGQDALAWKWRQGDHFFLDLRTEYKEKMLLMGKQIDKADEMKMVLGVTVGESGPGGVSLALKVERFSGRGQEIKGLEPFFKGATVKVTISREMRVTRIDGLAEAIEKALEKAGGGGTPQEKALVETALRALFQYWLEESLVAAPERATKKGDSWKQVTEMDALALGKLRTQRTLTDEGPETVGGKELRKFAFTGMMDYTVPKAGQPNPFPFTVKRVDLKKQSYRGTALFDGAAGRLARSDVKMSTHIAMTLEVQGMNHDAEAHRDQSFEVRILDKLPAE